MRSRDRDPGHFSLIRVVRPSSPHLSHSLDPFRPLALPSVCRCLLTQPFSGCAHTHPHLLLPQPHQTCLMVACIIALAGPSKAFQAGTSGKEPTCQCWRCKRHRFDPWFRDPGPCPWRRAWQPAPVFLPGESLGQRSLSGYSPQDCKEPDTAEATKHAHMVAITKSHRRGSLTTDMYYLAVLEAGSLRSGVFRAVSV